MSDPSSKIIITKTADGKTKRVIVKRVKKAIKLKRVLPKGERRTVLTSSPQSPQSPQSSQSSPVRGGVGGSSSSSGGGDRNKRPSIYAKNKGGGEVPSRFVRTARTSGGYSSSASSSGDNRGRLGEAGSGAKRHVGGGEAYEKRRGQDSGEHKKSKIYITKKGTKQSSSFERASSKRKFKRSHTRTRYKERGDIENMVGGREFSLQEEEANAYLNVPKKIELHEVVAITELARKLNLKAPQLIKKFLSLGVMNLRVSDNIDVDSAQIVCNELGCEVEVLSLLEQTKVETDEGEPQDYIPRPAIITIMGHVDHGKTTLLRTLTGEKIVAEAGGITQHVQAYSLLHSKRKMIFLDTPGHSAFFSMRAKGIKLTDMIILIISLTEGVKPQTLEVLALLKASDLPTIIVVTKIDMIAVPAEREKALREVKASLGEHDVGLVEWGGKVPLLMVSAEKKEGISELLETIASFSNDLKLTGNSKIKAYGYVLESQIVMGKGHVITIVIKNGMMRTGDAYLCHQSYGRVRAIFNEKSKEVERAGSGDVVQVIGLTSLVPTGKFFQIMENEKEARKTSEKRQELEKVTEASNVKKITVSNLFSAIQKESVKVFRIILKADAYGSVEAIHETLKQLKNSEVRTDILHFGVGPVSDSDVHLAITTGAELVAFKLRTAPKLQTLCEHEGVTLRHYEVIYDIIDAVKERLSGMLGEDREETVRANVTIKEVFKISGVGKVAGCEVSDGKVNLSHDVRIFRDETVVYTGKLSSLRRFKETVTEVVSGQDCGLTFKNFENFQAGDTIETFTITVKKRELTLSYL